MNDFALNLNIFVVGIDAERVENGFAETSKLQQLFNSNTLSYVIVITVAYSYQPHTMSKNNIKFDLIFTCSAFDVCMCWVYYNDIRTRHNWNAVQSKFSTMWYFFCLIIPYSIPVLQCTLNTSFHRIENWIQGGP